MRQGGSFYEFFAGGGMARAGLGAGWDCLFANDFDYKKSQSYKDNWGDDVLKTEDIRNLVTAQLPRRADLAWASFPCQDLSLAGGGAGLRGSRSGTFWPFWKLIEGLIVEKRAPSVVVIENVCGTLTSHGGRDFTAICGALRSGGYRYGALVVDATLFVPQSRPRLFIVAVRDDIEIHRPLCLDGPSGLWHTRAVRAAQKQLPYADQENWVWWDLPQPSLRRARLADLIENEPNTVRWHTPEETGRLLGLMSDLNREKVERARAEDLPAVGAIYKRTRRDDHGRRVQRAEIRFDGVAGCLRTPAGGSSRQLLMVVRGQSVRSRLISARETARLMGLPDTYILPDNYNDAYHLTGDGVVIPVVRYLAAHLLEPLLARGEQDGETQADNARADRGPSTLRWRRAPA